MNSLLRKLRIDSVSRLVQSLSRWRRALLALMLLAFLSRILRAQALLIIDRDGVRYIDQAAALLGGSWSDGFGGYYPPLYPLAIALCGLVLPLELAAITVNALASAATVWILAALLRPCIGPRAALWAAFTWIFAPSALHIGSQVLAESLALLLALLALFSSPNPNANLRKTIAWAWLRGAAIGLAVLARPESIALVGLLLWPAPRAAKQTLSRRALATLAALLALVLAILPYAIVLRAETGEWSFSRKAGVVAGALAPELSQSGAAALDQTMRAELEARKEGKELPAGGQALLLALIRTPQSLISKATRDLIPLTHEGIRLLSWPFFLMALAGIFLARTLPTDKRRTLWATGGPALWLALAVLFLARPKERYLLCVLPAACGFIGLALRIIEARCNEKGSKPITALIVTLIVVLGLAIGGRLEGRSKLFLRKLGAQLKTLSQPADLVLAPDGRIPYYANRPWRELPDLEEPETLRRFLQKVPARWLVLPRRSLEARWNQDLRVADFGVLRVRIDDSRRSSTGEAQDEWILIELRRD